MSIKLFLLFSKNALDYYCKSFYFVSLYILNKFLYFISDAYHIILPTMGFVVGLPTIILICSSMYECYAYIFNKHEENENQEQNMKALRQALLQMATAMVDDDGDVAMVVLATTVMDMVDRCR